MTVSHPTELEPIDLSVEQRQGLDEMGYFVVRDALTSGEIERLIRACDRIVDGNGRRNRWEGRNTKTEYRDIVSLDPIFIDLVANPRVLPLIVRVLGPRIHLTTSHLIYLHADEPPTPWHPDNGGWHRDHIGTTDDLGYAQTPRLSLRCGYYLTDVSAPGSGATLFVPGTHRLRRPLALPPGRHDPPGVDRPSLRPGDALVWENRVIHTAERNTSPAVRKAVMFQYSFRWLKPVDYRVHDPSLVEGRDAIVRQLLTDGDFNEDGSMTKMRGGAALTEWCARHGIVYEPAVT